MVDKEKITLQVTSEEKKRFRAVAEALGFTVAYGTEKDRGNMSALVRAIAAGEVVCIHADQVAGKGRI